MYKLPEIMNEFFDVRADGYDDHMKRNVENFDEFYAAVIEPIPFSKEKLNVLDIGCGTGMELKGLFSRLPNSMISCNDISIKMLEKLKRKYAAKSSQIKFIEGSYTELDFAKESYDYVISVMTVHHLLAEPKIALYKKIRNCLKDDGFYIEGDFVVDEKTEQEYREYYEEKTAEIKDNRHGKYHLDLPFTVEKQLKLFRKADFKEIDVFWKKASAAVFVCRK